MDYNKKREENNGLFLRKKQKDNSYESRIHRKFLEKSKNNE